MAKVVLGMSGGVDSSVAALLLKESGYDVFGIYLDIGTAIAADDARGMAEFLKIPLTVVDIQDELDKHVCTPFAEAYRRGETPNPCIMCNPNVKFRNLFKYAEKLGAEKIATGHYAIVDGNGDNARLFKGSANDQSYILCRITREQLGKLILPLGSYDKNEVREIAHNAGLSVADKPDSMEICFIPDGDYAAFVESRGVAPATGDFTDVHGNVLGRHLGIHRYTVGQSRGLGIALGSRMYVTELRPDTNVIILSMDPPLATTVAIEDMHWLVPEPEVRFKAAVKLRHSKAETMAWITPNGDNLSIEFDAPVRSAAPGQAAALYSQQNQLLGGGIIIR